MLPCHHRPHSTLQQHEAFIYFLLPLASLIPQPKSAAMGMCISNHIDPMNISLPVDSPFQLPSPLSTWPKGGGGCFATGVIDLGGGLQVAQVTSFKKIWSSYEGGAGNLGASLFEPSPIPDGFSLLGYYAQPNNQPLFGWVLVGKDSVAISSSASETSSSNKPALANPTDYSLVWSSSNLAPNIKQDGPVFIWLPVPPNGYKAIGHALTTSQHKPSLDLIRCVRAELTVQSEPDKLIWGGTNNDIYLYSSKPTNIGVGATGVSLGTFIATQTTTSSSSSSAVSCLKNSEGSSCAMPDADQIKALIQTYSPFIYVHPDEQYFPSTVNWFFANGGLLYKKGNEANPVTIQSNGANLPQGGSNDGAYWLDLPTEDNDEKRVKKGDLSTAGCYFHVKPMFGGTFTDLAMWVYYPYNGPARAKVGLIKSVSLGKIGEHMGDWEHVTLRISNFNGELRRVYFSQHSKGVWEELYDLEYRNGNRVVAYSSLHGHAMYPKPGLVLQGNEIVRIRNDTERSGMVLDSSNRYEVISADYEVRGGGVVEPPWVNYMREWGPKITYDLGKEIGKITRFLPGKLKKDFEKVVRSLPAEVLGEQGPIGPKGKKNWDGDEFV